jgi:hypothetical protein
MKKLILLICAGFLFTSAFSQNDVVEFLKGGKADANALVKAYLDPYAMALGDGLNNGWYNSAATHKLFGFDLSINASAIQIPSNGTTFDLNAIGLTKLTLADPTKSIAPTVAGKDVEGPRLLLKDNTGSTIVSFNTPNGLDLNIVPVPMVQIGFGLLPHTDIIGRYVPDIKYDNEGDQMKIGFWGFGIKHNFKEWIPILKSLPFDASIFGSISQVDAQSDLSYSAQELRQPNVTITFVDANDQQLKFSTKTSKFGLIVSKKIGILTVFGSIGKSASETSIDLLGTYPVTSKIEGGGLVVRQSDALIDPVAVSFNSNNVCMDAGLRIKLLFFSLYGSVNKAEYTSYNAGVSFGFR